MERISYETPFTETVRIGSESELLEDWDIRSIKTGQGDVDAAAASSKWSAHVDATGLKAQWNKCGMKMQ